MSTAHHRLELQRQLDELLSVERPRLLSSMGAVDGNDPADQADRAALEFDLAQLDVRIRRLQDRLTGRGRPQNGTGGLVHGASLVLDFGDGPETFLVSDAGGVDDVDVVTPDSPLGRALAAAAVGESLTYGTPRGEIRVTLVAVDVPAAA